MNVPLGVYTTTVTFWDGGERRQRQVKVQLEGDLPRIAAQLAHSAARSKQRPRRATLAGGKLRLVVLEEQDLIG